MEVHGAGQTFVAIRTTITKEATPSRSDLIRCFEWRVMPSIAEASSGITKFVMEGMRLSRRLQAPVGVFQGYLRTSDPTHVQSSTLCPAYH